MEIANIRSSIKIDGSVLKEERTKKGRTQQDVADSSRLSLRTIQRAEAGEVTLDNLQSICRTLDYPLADLVDELPVDPLDEFFTDKYTRCRASGVELLDKIRSADAFEFNHELEPCSSIVEPLINLVKICEEEAEIFLPRQNKPIYLMSELIEKEALLNDSLRALEEREIFIYERIYNFNGVRPTWDPTKNAMSIDYDLPAEKYHYEQLKMIILVASHTRKRTIRRSFGGIQDMLDPISLRGGGY